jgi:hypothetical protein
MFLYSGDKQFGLNIRLVEVKDLRILETNPNLKIVYFLTEGYSGTIDECVKKINISYCPFCGQKLSEFYSSEYTNEQT